jgi:hypothetical protein
MQHYGQTCCLTDAELSNELRAVRLDGLRSDAQPQDDRLVALRYSRAPRAIEAPGALRTARC